MNITHKIEIFKNKENKMSNINDLPFVDEELNVELDEEQEPEEQRGRKPKYSREIEKLKDEIREMKTLFIKATEGIKAVQAVNQELAKSYQNKNSSNDVGSKLLLELYKAERERNDSLLEKMMNTDKKEELSLEKITELLNNPLVDGIINKNSVPYDKLLDLGKQIAEQYFSQKTNVPIMLKDENK